MDPIVKILQDTALISLGIAPIGSTHDDVNRALDKLPPDEARRMKRKFRKLWRKFVAAETKGRRRSRQEAVTGKGQLVPTRRQKIARKSLVNHKILHDVVMPLVRQGSVNSPPDGV